MARSSSLFVWVVLAVFGLSLAVIVALGDDDQAAMSGSTASGGGIRGDGVKGDGGDGFGGDDGGDGGEGLEDDRGVDFGSGGDAPLMEEGQGSDTRSGDDTEGIFQDLPELSNGGRLPRLRQSTLLEAFGSASRQGQLDKGTNGSAGEEGDEDSYDDDFDVEVEAKRAVKEEAEEEEEERAGRPAAQGKGDGSMRELGWRARELCLAMGH